MVAMRAGIERASNFLLTIAALCVAGVAIHREFLAAPAKRDVRASAPTFMSDWKDIANAGVLLGDSGAKVTIVEFADFECPFCRAYQTTLKTVQARYASSVAIAFVHFPLNIHRFAIPAAKAAECAGQARFSAMADRIYASQDSLGLKSWAAIAREAGVRDTIRFGECVRGADGFGRIDAGRAIAKRIGARGTPLIVVNGWRFDAPPSDSILSHTIEALLADRKPY